jgi:hypothetical protein
VLGGLGVIGFLRHRLSRKEVVRVL